ncbi:hypothetical protein ACVWXO_003451 [Bradyrhizobium sp. LM2.7]
MSGSRRIKPRFGNNYAISTFAALLMAAVASVASNQLAASQRTRPPRLNQRAPRLRPVGSET